MDQNNLKMIYPVIISASRRTDIPAFFMNEFIKTINKGEMLWKNPFNPAQKKYICFDKTRLAVFWSKNPAPLLDNIDYLNNKGIHFYLHYTINNYPEYFEPHLPLLDRKIELLQKITDKTKMKNIIWRFDPIILSGNINEDHIYNSIFYIGNKLKGYTERLIISFVQFYSRMEKRSCKNKITYKKLNIKEKLDIFINIGAIGKQFGFEIMSCAESMNMNNELENLGIQKGKCIDPDLIKNLFFKDNILMDYLENVKKDKNQRKECGCIQSIDIGTYNTCRHNCLYCYAK